MPAKLPSSMLRQHAARYAARNMKHDVYRDKRRQIINGLIAMHGDLDPLDSTDPLSVLEEAAAKRRATRRRNLTTGIGGLLLALAVSAATPTGQQAWQQLIRTPSAQLAQHPQADFQHTDPRQLAGKLATEHSWSDRQMRDLNDA